MKPFETIKQKLKLAELVMFACFILGGFCVIFSVYLHFFVEGFVTDYRSTLHNGSVNETFRNNYINLTNMPPPRVDPISFARFFTFPNNAITLIAGIVLLMAGLAIHSLTTSKRTQLVIKRTTEALLTPDEKLILDIIIKNNGEITQKELTINSGLSKVKVFRITERLEAKGVIVKKEYGQTRKIFLKTD